MFLTTSRQEVRDVERNHVASLEVSQDVVSRSKSASSLRRRRVFMSSSDRLVSSFDSPVRWRKPSFMRDGGTFSSSSCLGCVSFDDRPDRPLLLLLTKGEFLTLSDSLLLFPSCSVRESRAPLASAVVTLFRAYFSCSLIHERGGHDLLRRLLLMRSTGLFGGVVTYHPVVRASTTEDI